MNKSTDTPPFHTFSLVRGDITHRWVEAIEAASEGDDSMIQSMTTEDEGLKNILSIEDCDLSEGREACGKTDSSLLLVGLTIVDSNGERAPHKVDGKIRERLGRYPWGDGNPLTYLTMWSGNSPDSHRDIMEMIDRLNQGLSEKTRNHDRFENGSFATMHGLLSGDETKAFHEMLTAGEFKVLADEPLDGGVADIMRHLKSIVREATRSGCGILHFSH